MKTALPICLAAIFTAASGFHSPAATDLVIDVLPGSVLANFSADGFYVNGPNGKQELSMISAIPNAAMGLSISQPEGFIDLKAGAGLLLNSRLSSVMFYGDAAFLLEAKPGFLIGPHAALTYFSKPDWWGDEAVSFSNDIGYNLGLRMCAGDRISYLLSIDYMSMAFDVTSTPAGYSTNKNKLEMSGLAVHFGVRAQF